MKVALLVLCSTIWAHSIFAQREIRSNGNRSIQITASEDFKNTNENKKKCFSALDTNLISTGILYDRISGISQIDHYSGKLGSKKASIDILRQIYFELEQARNKSSKLDKLKLLEESFKGKKTIPIFVLDYQYEKIKENAQKTGLIELTNGKYLKSGNSSSSILDLKNVFVSACSKKTVFNGSDLRFRIDRSSYLTNIKASNKKIEIDFDDNLGSRQVNWDEDIHISYRTKGEKNIAVSVTDENNSIQHSSFVLKVENLTTPSYEDIPLVADIPFEGVYASGNAYVFKSPLNDVVKNPIVIAEGFDMSNEMFADELYNLFNQQNTASCLLNNGFDLVFVNYTESKTYIQANAMLFVKVMQYLNQNYKASLNGNVVIGASMGGLVARYGLSYMEKHNIPHETKLFAAFDSPNRGANVPLGDQLWINFFANQNDAAASKINQINSVAAQQMLVYHHLSYPEDNPYRMAFVKDLAEMGYPKKPRLMAVANGSANGKNQAYEAGEQIIQWKYRSVEVDVDGNVWAVPNMEPMTTIVDCKVDKIWPLPDQSLEIQVKGTQPYDNAPGGYRSSNQEIADTDAGYGKINTDNPNHCFIPTISSLDINTDDLFYNVSADTALLSKTPFNVVYYSKTFNPDLNQMHMFISPEAANWIFNEVRPISIELNGKSRNKGEVTALKSVKLRPGFHAGPESGFHSTTNSITNCMSTATGTDASPIVSSGSNAEQSKTESSSSQLQIEAYPNPNDGNFSISISEQTDADVSIYNMMGCCVYKASFGSGTANVNLSHCDNGFYLLNIKTGDKHVIKKIVISR